MKYLSSIMIAMMLITSTSCTKNNPAPPSYPGGSWSINTVTFYATACIASTPILTATDTLTGNPSCNLIVSFYDSLPANGGTYTVADQGAQLAPGQVSVSVGYVAPGVLNNYASTGGNGDQKITVSVSNGKLSVSGTGIEMINTGLGSDSTAINFHITQTM